MEDMGDIAGINIWKYTNIDKTKNNTNMMILKLINPLKKQKIIF